MAARITSQVVYLHQMIYKINCDIRPSPVYDRIAIGAHTSSTANRTKEKSNCIHLDQYWDRYCVGWLCSRDFRCLRIECVREEHYTWLSERKKLYLTALVKHEIWKFQDRIDKSCPQVDTISAIFWQQIEPAVPSNQHLYQPCLNYLFYCVAQRKL